MRYVVRWAACLAMALLSAGCDLSSTQGVGTRLYPADVAAQTDLQNAYVGEICQQAGILPTAFDGVTSCGPNPYDAATWWLFVQAGMNDIDQRCDAYLAWLDDAQRSREPVLNELALASATAQTIMRSTGVGANPITIAGAAFGLAAGTFTNVQSRLILTMPHSTIQAVVLSRQKEYRDRLIGTTTTKAVAIVSRPAALYALRSYLRLCMPMTIETEINNTIATFERNGADGLEKGSLISPRSAGVPFTPASVVQQQKRATVVPPDADVAPFFAEKDLSKAETETTLNALCFDKNKDIGLPRKDLIRELVAIYEASDDGEGAPPKADGIIDRIERLAINKQLNCNAARNYFERIVFANTQSPKKKESSAKSFTNLITALTKSTAGNPLTGSPALDSKDLRDKVRAVRTASGLNDVAPQLSTHITAALMSKLPQ
ncbi:hypothetical protein JQ617_17090 [Bradyrhizobium sp. KB893862 SZCCT0404]|uniref:hypothetical protein n=1 Tax=Bradyrhizobium sp. KB893862 SZCCT0404 TaxID=2807672 RepID=UPI001BAB5C57|nr:hypothetical protein [Bradyrhizobium sp. KB893862 SZCCT0404]MBR1175676.1 hypothetical protein [Bradyrhizobium sp. KB893862 SZCCT0404]